ncbi:MAG: tyrosine-type recombinase/integrase [Ignavibacteriaceae bacterium]|nr:tyrosine-type recombinase/integrase [Ignavibacteriaceae bacterium]
MNKTKAKHLYKKSGFWFIRYKNPGDKSWKGISTGIKDLDKNLNAAKIRRDQFLEQIRNSESLKVQDGTIEDAFNRFKELNSNKSESTKSTYKYFFEYLKNYLDVSQPCVVLNKLSSEGFLSWLFKLDDLEQNTKYGIQKNFVKFLNFLFEYEYLPKIFKLNKDVRLKPLVKEPIIFSDKDRKKIISELVTQEKNENFQLMIYLLMYSGLRPSDIINLTAEQIDLEKMEMRFYSSKTGNWFVRPIHNNIKEILTKSVEGKKSERLFDYSEVKNMGKAFQRYLSDIGLAGKNYDLRTFRKDFISRSQEAGVPINVTASLVGHSNIKTTMTYYTKLSSNHLKKELKKLK